MNNKCNIPENINIILRCKRCKKRIHTYIEDRQLEGLFLADDIVWSEVLETAVIFMGKVTCAQCLTTY